MLKIAVCDDEEISLKTVFIQVQNLLKERYDDFKLDSYSSSLELLKKCSSENYDLILLDIDMPELNGFEVSAYLRKNCIFSSIIFISSRENFVFQSIKYKPFRFIRKSCLDTELKEGLEDYLHFYLKKNMLCSFRIDDSVVSVQLNKIMYFDSYNHDILINMEDKTTFKLNRKYNLKVLENQFAEHGFIRVHKSYLVNFRYINIIKETDVILNNNTIIPSTRQRVTKVKTQYRNFIMEDM